MKKCFTAESFGADCPKNWEEIANTLNKIAEDRGITEDREALDDLWEAYWNGELDAPVALA